MQLFGISTHISSTNKPWEQAQSRTISEQKKQGIHDSIAVTFSKVHCGVLRACGCFTQTPASLHDKLLLLPSARTATVAAAGGLLQVGRVVVGRRAHVAVWTLVHLLADGVHQAVEDLLDVDVVFGTGLKELEACGGSAQTEMSSTGGE